MQPLQAALALGAALALCLQGQGAQAQPAMPLTDLCAQYPALSMCAAEENGMVKRKSAYMRFGKRAPMLLEEEPAQAGFFSLEQHALPEKRKSAYMRFGKRAAQAEEALESADLLDVAPEKRKSAYMRFGKRKSAYMRFGKRSADLLDAGVMQKRKVASLRFG